MQIERSSFSAIMSTLTFKDEGNTRRLFKRAITLHIPPYLGLNVWVECYIGGIVFELGMKQDFVDLLLGTKGRSQRYFLKKKEFQFPN